MPFNTYPYSPFPASTEQLHKGDNEDLQAQIDAIKDGTDIDSFGDVEMALGVVTGDIAGLETDKADNTVIAPEFDAEAGVYDIGDLVMYQGKLYEFTLAHETAGAWDSTEVIEKTVADEINAINSNLANMGTYSNSPVKIGKWFNHDLYRLVINCGTLPNNDALTVSTGLQSSVNAVNVRGIAMANANSVPMPNSLFNIKLYYDKDNNQIVIETDRDLRNYTGYVVIEYYS